MKGTVKFYNVERGYGFLSLEDGMSQDLFFHIRDVAGGTILQPRDLVEFDAGISPKSGRPAARNVRYLGARLNAPVQFGGAAS